MSKKLKCNRIKILVINVGVINCTVHSQPKVLSDQNFSTSRYDKNLQPINQKKTSRTLILHNNNTEKLFKNWRKNNFNE